MEADGIVWTAVWDIALSFACDNQQRKTDVDRGWLIETSDWGNNRHPSSIYQGRYRVIYHFSCH